MSNKKNIIFEKLNEKYGKNINSYKRNIVNDNDNNSKNITDKKKFKTILKNIEEKFYYYKIYYGNNQIFDKEKIKKISNIYNDPNLYIEHNNDNINVNNKNENLINKNIVVIDYSNKNEVDKYESSILFKDIEKRIKDTEKSFGKLLNLMDEYKNTKTKNNKTKNNNYDVKHDNGINNNTFPESEKKIYQIKNNINIDVEINNISDLLKIIDDYKYNPENQYNINLEALHNIKEPLIELNSMIGMKNLKENIVDQILYFIQDLHIHSNKGTCNDFLHTVIYGPPGTGKTEIAKIMGQVFSKLGILKKGTFKKVTRADLIAGYLGQTAIKTSDVIKEALDGVLFIDEAYALGNPEKKDSFSKECIDTLCEALSDNKDRLMVIIAGYEIEMKECFFSFNQGLDSRFPWRFKIDHYKGEELYKIFLKKINDIGWSIHETDQDTIKKINSEWFNKNLIYFKYFGRDIETFLSKIKICHSRRVFCKPAIEKTKLTYKDIEKGFELFLKNDEIKNRKEQEDRKYQMSSLYI
jgi:SpoVK/Ycf46/Vps4 family AAA+-type ATPase